MWMRHVTAGLVALAIAPFSAPAAAGPAMPTVRVAGDQAPVFERTDPRSAVMFVASGGTVLEAIDKEGDWYWVLMARDANGTRRTGWIEGRRVEIVTPAAPGVAPRTLTGQAEDAHAAAAAPRKTTNAADDRSDARLRKALSALEQARRQYEAVTKPASEPR